MTAHDAALARRRLDAWKQIRDFIDTTNPTRPEETR